MAKRKVPRQRETIPVSNSIGTERTGAEHALRESEAMNRALLEAIPDVMIRVSGDGTILDFKPAKWMDTPAPAAEIVGKNTYDVLPPEGAEKAMHYVRQALQTGEVQLYEYRLPVDGEMRERETRAVVSGEEEVVLIVRDITERKRAELEVRLLQTLTQAMTEAEDFDAALNVALREVCQAIGWVYGEAWVPRAGGTGLACSPGWYSTSDHLEHFGRASEGMIFVPDHDRPGLPGRVWASGAPEWVEDVSIADEAAFRRTRMAAEAGLKAAVSVPIIADDGRILAVLLFFLGESRAEERRMVDLVSAVAAQLGSVVQRKQADEALRESEATKRPARRDAGHAV